MHFTNFIFTEIFFSVHMKLKKLCNFNKSRIIFSGKIKIFKHIIFLQLKLFSWKIIFPLSIQPFNNNIAIIESKIIYFSWGQIFVDALRKQFFWIKETFVWYKVREKFSLIQRNRFDDIKENFWINKTFFNSKKFLLWPYIKQMSLWFKKTVFSVHTRKLNLREK